MELTEPQESARVSPWIRVAFMLGLIPGLGLPVWATQHQDPPLRPHALFLAGLVAPVLAIASFVLGSRAARSSRPWAWIVGILCGWALLVVLVLLPLTPAPVHL
jgi:hypothetical protein